LFVVEAVCWLIVIMHLAQKLPNRPSAKLKVYTELVMPFYILHETVLTIVSFYVFQLDLNAYLSCFVFSSISFGIVIALALIIRKINPLRFLFGLSTRTRSAENNKKTLKLEKRPEIAEK
jgi:glucan biosynthesis protein C